MPESKSSSGGIGFCGLLTIAFIVLKLCNVIAWSWWWVTSPLWIPLALLIGFAVFALPFWIVKWCKANNRLKEYRRQGAFPKSKWQQRLDQMREAQEKAAKHN